MPSTNNDNPSPSASSIFLPLGKRARRDSKSSLATEIDQEALNQALDTIHTAASQSQILTVFNEYTDPPPATARDENKSLTGDLQGGLSGLYNKLKASVGVTGDVVEPRPPLSSKAAGHERSASKASSGKTSNVQSPRAIAFDTVDSAELTSKLSSKAPSISKISSGPASVKSPTGPPQPAPHLVDPTLTEVTIHAQNRSAAHSRNTSQTPAADAKGQVRSPPAKIDSDILHKIVSQSTQPESSYDRQDSRVTSPAVPQLAKVKVDDRHHKRTDSDYSGRGPVNSQPTSPTLDHQERRADRSVDGRQERAPPRPPASGSFNVDGDASHQPGKIPTISDSLLDKESSLRSKSPSRTERPKERLLPHISQSRLPGFAASRASSTDSGVTGIRSRNGQNGVATDGSRDVRFEQQARPANKLRSKLLNREFWMRDENARDCFHCGEPFTTFRRKHHCRTCGQIFDNKCTVLVSGSSFGSMGAVRVCRPCEAIIMSHDDDSSDYSVESMAVQESSTRPRTPDPAHLLQSARFDDDNISVVSQSLEQMARTPTMSLPVRRAYDAGDRSSKVLEFDGDRALPRPSSSRSLKATHSIGHGHKRHHSRHQHIRSYKAYHDERAPFQRRTAEDIAKDPKASAFHRDSIIDPDLAQYLSDDASSGDEQSLSMQINADKSNRNNGESDRTPIGGLLAAVRKGRSRIGDRSIAGFLNFGRDSREGDDASIISSRVAEHVRPPRKRNLSIASSVHHRLTPRATKERLQFALGDGSANAQNSAMDPIMYHKSRVSRMIRSASMHGVGAPALELNRASIQHVHKLLQQLLRDADVLKTSSWENALAPILLRATDDVDPDVQNGDDIDIRNYVKLKKVPGGKPGDTAYISGLIFTKNVALKSMRRLVMQPRILIITFALEYTRHEQHFMSLDPVIRQEREYLQNLVSRIAALKPDVLFAQRNVSGLALELLDNAKIATIFNVKSSVLEAVSRCTQTRVIHSVDKLSSLSGQLGTCESFEVKTFVFEGRKKTFVYLSGCPPDLGCTVAIRGGDKKTLHKIKRIAEFMIYVVYNLKLETCLMRDEWALIPTGNHDENNKARSIATGTADSTEAKDTSNNNTVKADGLTTAGLVPSEDKAAIKDVPLNLATTLESAETADIPDDIPVPTFYEDMADKHETKILSASPFVKFAPPYILMRARELERRVAYLKRLRDQDLSAEQNMDEKAKIQKFTLIQPEMLHTSLTGTSKKVREIIHAVHDAEYDKALHNYDTQKKQWEAYLSGNRNLFDPYAHQNIVVLFSFVATATSVPCSGPDLLAFSFYNEHEHEDDFEADCTLGQYVEDLCYRANDACSSGSCEKKMFEHHRQYVHGQAQISVFVQPYPSKMRGLQDVILMWSQCKVCGVETTVTPMSSSSWKYSFGKYLELSFWSADLHARAGICPHDLHRDHLRYFGYKDFALRVHYDPIDLLEIVVPRMRITWKVDNDLKFRNEVFTKIEHRITRFMSSVKLRLKSINAEAILPENVEGCRAEIETLLKRANDEHTALIKQLQERYSNSAHWEILPLNRAIRLTQEKVAEWDTTFTDFEQSYFPSEKDIRRLATLQLKKIFLDRDVSVTSLTSDAEESSTPPAEDVIDEKTDSVEPDDPNRTKRTTALSPEKTQSVLQAVLEEHASPPGASQEVPSTPKPVPADKEAGDLPNLHARPRKTSDVQHLDLATSPNSGIHSTVHEQGTSASQPIAVPASRGVGPQAANPKVASAAAVNDRPTTPTTPTPAKSQATDQQDMATPRPTQTMRGASPLIRSQSQPVASLLLHKDVQLRPEAPSSPAPLPLMESKYLKASAPTSAPENEATGEKKLSDRLGLSQLKNSKFVKNHSLIPRAISHRKESRVSNLAKHFEQLSREFERERVRERKQKAARNRQSRIYPLAVPKPIVEVYRNVHEAVDEPDVGDDGFDVSAEKNVAGLTLTSGVTTLTKSFQQANEGDHTEDTPAENTETDVDVQLSSHAPSEAEDQSDVEDDGGIDILPDSPEDLLRLSQEDIDFKELQKHERTSLMKMLTNFWAERSSSGWAPLEYPLAASEHIFADCDILVREDEPSSIIAFALASADYKAMLNDIHDTAPTANTPDEVFGHTHNLDGDLQSDVMHSLLRKTGTHLKYQFQEGQAKMLCKIFFAEQFDAVRRKCGVADRIVESLSRCLKWDSKGGKTKSLFLKTLDDRFILKSLSPIETQSFLKFAPNYFQIMSEAFFHELPSVIAKMLGFYQIIIKNPITGVEYNWYLLVMENLFYDRTPTRIFDLKGSMRNRKINATGERNEVLLDENMVEFIYESPLFAREHSKKLLRSSVHNDTLFLARQNVMDYSLMIAIDDHAANSAGHRKDKELVVGIIDCIRTYTWDKKLESWIKDRGFAGGGKNRPTVTSPKEYKRRFREAMGRYVLEAPSCWHQIRGVRVDGGRGDVRREVGRNRDEAEREGSGGLRLSTTVEMGEDEREIIVGGGSGLA